MSHTAKQSTLIILVEYQANHPKLGGIQYPKKDLEIMDYALLSTFEDKA